MKRRRIFDIPTVMDQEKKKKKKKKRKSSQSDGISKGLKTTARNNRHMLSDDDLGLGIDYDSNGLMNINHAAVLGFANADAAKHALDAVIVGAGMTNVSDGAGHNSRSFWRGTWETYFAAEEALGGIAWANHVVGTPDIGTAFCILPHGANNVKFIPNRMIFNV